MNRLEARSLLPERPNPLSWFAFVLLGLIGTYLAGSVAAASTGIVGGAVIVIGIAAGAVNFHTAYVEARKLDESEVWA